MGPSMVSEACQEVTDQLDRAATCTGPPQDVLSLLEQAQQLLQVGYILHAACPMTDSNVDPAMLRSQSGASPVSGVLRCHTPCKHFHGSHTKP